MFDFSHIITALFKTMFVFGTLITFETFGIIQVGMKDSWWQDKKFLLRYVWGIPTAPHKCKYVDVLFQEGYPLELSGVVPL